METRSSARLKHKLEDEKESPAKKVKSTKASESSKEKKTTKSHKKDAATSKASAKKGSTSKSTSTPTKKEAKEDENLLHESSTLESGHIYFFYRPKVEHDEAHSADDVQKLYMVLKPERGHGGAQVGKNRLVVMGAKRLPTAHNRFWSFVEAASADISKITNKLEPVDYETKTKGDRHLEGCRPCGCGVYSIVHHLEGKYKSSQHTHIAYVMEVPDEMGEVQKAFQIRKEGSFIVTVKNPQSQGGQGRQLKPSSRANYPEELQKKFGTKKFIPAEPAKLLDFDGVELILIGSKDDIKSDLGKPAEKLEEKAEEEEEEEDVKHDHGCDLAEEQVFHKLHMRHKEHPAEPLIDGKWE